MNWFDLVVLILASFRLTHLIVFDAIMEPVRARLEHVWFIGAVVTCYWCAGVWVSLMLVGGYLLWPAVVWPVLLVLAVAAGQALLERLTNRD